MFPSSSSLTFIFVLYVKAGQTRISLSSQLKYGTVVHCHIILIPNDHPYILKDTYSFIWSVNLFHQLDTSGYHAKWFFFDYQNRIFSFLFCTIFFNMLTLVFKFRSVYIKDQHRIKLIDIIRNTSKISTSTILKGGIWIPVNNRNINNQIMFNSIH